MIEYHVRRAGQYVTAGHETLSGAKGTARTYLQTNPAGEGFGEAVAVVDADGLVVGTWTTDPQGKASWTPQADAQTVRGFLVDYVGLARRDAGPDDVLRLRTGWPARRITAALRVLGLLNEHGQFRQGWFELVKGA
jgi:hypothetical protein